MTSNANKYQARVYEAYRAWCKVLRDDSMLDTIAESFGVDPWHIERAHRTALDLDQTLLASDHSQDTLQASGTPHTGAGGFCYVVTLSRAW